MEPFDAALPGDLLPSRALDEPALLDQAIERIAERASLRRAAPAREPDVDTSLHVRPDGSPALLLVGTRSREPLTATISLEAAATVEDLLDGARFAAETLSIPLEPYGVRLLRFA
jgi:hypothetical protein